MADIDTRPYSRDYSGLVNQAGFGGFLLMLCWTGYELMRSTRRHRKREAGWGWTWKEPLGSVEQQGSFFPEANFPELLGLVQAFSFVFFGGCFRWYSLLHTFTTLPVLLPINVVLTPVTEDNPERSMTRASLSQLISTSQGISLLWVHQLALWWLFITWLGLLWWLSRGLWRWRERSIFRAKRAIEQGISVLSPLTPSQNRPPSRWRRDKKSRRKTETATEQIAREQEGNDLEASNLYVKGEPLPPSIYNTRPEYSSTSHPPYPHIHALHPLPPSAHPHTPYAPSPTSIADRGLRLRTVMVSNVPVGMRSEADLKEYFEYYMGRELLVPAITPGFLPRVLNWFMHRKPARAAAKRVFRERRQEAQKKRESLPPDVGAGVATPPNGALKRDGVPHEDSNPAILPEGLDFGIIDSRPDSPSDPNVPPPIIERVVICRKMTELASRVERREQYLRKLEAAHCKLAVRTLESVKEYMVKGDKGKKPARPTSADVERGRRTEDKEKDNKEDEEEEEEDDDEYDEEKEHARMEVLVRELGPFVEEFYPDFRTQGRLRKSVGSGGLFKWRHKDGDGYGRVSREGSDETGGASYPPMSPVDVKIQDQIKGVPTTTATTEKKTIWHVLHALPRSYLDPYQPLVSLHTLFRGATAPAIDYYHSKVGFLTGLIQESRTVPQRDLRPTSTAFVTFHSPEDARRCVKYLPNHPDNILACIVEPAPDWRDLDWHRIGRSTFTGEFVRDWIVKIGVWAFTLFWVIPVTALVALISVDKISAFFPGLASYLSRHSYQKELITAFVPTLLVAILAILVPLLLLLIAKQAHTILTLSRLHDTIMVRYYKFLVCNVLVFFCIGTTSLNAILDSLRQNPGIEDPTDSRDFVKIVATSFPNAAPFYVGWLVFQTAMHSGLELGLYGLPLFVYPSTRGSTTLRRREVGIRPRTYNFYYWLPNHITVVLILVIFTVLNPLVVPFSLVYFSAATVVHKNQLMRVYSKWYDQNGTVILVRILRYSLDGFIFAHIVFLALNALTKRSNKGLNEVVLTGNVILTCILLAITVATKVYLTTVLRAKFDELDKKEAAAYHNPQQMAAERGIQLPEQPVETTASPEAISEMKEDPSQDTADFTGPKEVEFHPGSVRLWNWKLPTDERFPYKTLPDQLPQPSSPRAGIPFDVEPQSPEGLSRKLSVASSSRTLPSSFPRRWSVGAVGSGGVGFPKELNDVRESLESPTTPTSPISPTSPKTATSTAPLVDPEVLNQARLSLERGEETTIPLTAAITGLDSHGRGRPGPGRATISFDTPPVPVREKKKSTASSSAKSAVTKSTASAKRSFVDLPASLPFFRARSLSTGAPPVPLVQPHPPTGPWDDSPRYDIPFQNPAYVCPIDDFLWLPRNPCGKLNLDDSIEMRKAIRTEVHLGGLGEWIDDGTSVDVIPRNTVDSHMAVPGTIADADALTISSTGDDFIAALGQDDAGGIPLTRQATTKSASSGYTRKLLNGMERIHLPPGIRARVPKKGADEFGFKRRKIATPSTMAQAPVEEIEPSEGVDMVQEGYFTVKAKPPLSRPGWPSQLGRTSSKHSSPRGEGHVSTSTLAITRHSSSRSVFSRHSNISKTSMNPDVALDPAVLPDLSSHSPFADPSLSIVITRSSLASPSSPPQVGMEDMRRTASMFATGGLGDEGRLTLETQRGYTIGAPESGQDVGIVIQRRLSQAGRSVSSKARSSRAGSVSVRDAIVGEVLAEEQIATAKRLKEEMDEAERVSGPRSYWTGWMWRQVPNNNPLPSPQTATAIRRVLRDAVGDAGPPA
ncbi:hypothetical protein M408DRAFT_17948 [Serendipita vermifera MAFF 305830]|uniref:CSC1/OSCA1-like 7TM region domain-containing protein n=1 Tax=Serendipita vermifera MAFF 305830 TaxID=933852 RepID=A0A0C2X105_SERVB|nr:hypothetical protein M408DRAFT_17948 [Serendipita vermifera MAFF 305830]